MNKNRQKSPAPGLRLIRFFANEYDHDSLIGDISEMYNSRLSEDGWFKTNTWFWFQIMRLFPLLVLHSILWNIIMLKNYVKTALRQFRKHWSYTSLNMFGLAIGIACFTLIMLYINDELSYDTHYKNADRIVRLVNNSEREGIVTEFAMSSAPFAPAILAEIPEVNNAARFMIPSRRLIQRNDTRFYEEDISWTDASVFQVFSIPFLSGNPATALNNPSEVVICKEIADKYFGNEDPINQTLLINGSDFTITGVVEDMPENSHFRIRAFMSMVSLEQQPRYQSTFFTQWGRKEFYTYLLLDEGASIEDVNEKLSALIEKHATEQFTSDNAGTISSELQPLKAIHLRSDRLREIRPGGDIRHIYIFSVIAVFILIIACINFMNLSAARSAIRAREVGMRKVVGADRLQIITQFLGESVVQTLFSGVISALLVLLAIPYFNTLTGKHFELNSLGSPVIITSLAVTVLAAGLFSGSYPAFFISAFRPASVLKGQYGSVTGSSRLRKVLVVIQFSISITLIVCTVTVLDQLDFLMNRTTGFDKEHVVVVPIRNSEIRNQAESIKEGLMQNPNIVNAAISLSVPGGLVAVDAIDLVMPAGKERHSVRMIYTDHDFVRTLGIEIKQGRDFSKSIPSDAREAFIINEAAVSALNLANPLDAEFIWGAGGNNPKQGRVIGVVKDFQYASARNELSPLVIHIETRPTRVFAIRIRPENIRETITFIEEKFSPLAPDYPFEYSFTDEIFDRVYRFEQRLSLVFRNFSALAIFIAAMGLFGLAAFMVERRTKEISIRKVLGAPVSNIFMLVSKEFSILVIAANISAWPAAYFAMGMWLDNFAFRVDLRVEIFVASGFSALLIALLTVSWQSVRAALLNPAESLRNE